MQKNVNKKRLDITQAEAAVFEAIEEYIALVEARTRDRSERWSEREETFRRATGELRECETRLREITERQSAMEGELNRVRLRGDAFAESDLIDEYASLQGERRDLEGRIKEARAVVNSYQRYGEPSDPSSALAKEIARQSPLKGYDGFKRRLLTAVEAGRSRIRGAIH